MTLNCTSGRSIFLCQAISKCSLVETAFLLLVTVSTVKSGHSNPFPDIIWWSSDSCRVCLRCTINCSIITDGTKISIETETFFYRKLIFPNPNVPKLIPKLFSPNTKVSETETQTLKNDNLGDRLSSFIFDNFWMGTQLEGDLPVLNDLIGSSIVSAKFYYQWL